MTLLSLIVASFNGLELLRRCLAAAEPHIATELAHEWIVVDDGSTDGTREWLEARRGPGFRPLILDANAGYAAANNRAAQLARGRWLLFLNNDVVVRPGWLEPLVAAMHEQPGAFAIGNLQFRFDSGDLDHAGIVFTEWGHPYHFRADLDRIRAQPVREFPAVTFACALVEREKFFALGGFDERFRNGCEDVDLCLRARRRGWPSFVATASTVEHHVSATPGRKEHEDANIALFFERWQPLAAAWGRDWETRLLLQRSPHDRPAPHGAWGDARPAGPTRLLVDASLPPAEADPHATAERLREFLIALRAAGTPPLAFDLLLPADAGSNHEALGSGLADAWWLAPPAGACDPTVETLTLHPRQLTCTGTTIARALQADAILAPFGVTTCSSPDVPECVTLSPSAAEVPEVLRAIRNLITEHARNRISWRWADALSTTGSDRGAALLRPTSPPPAPHVGEPGVLLHVDEPRRHEPRTPLFVIKGWAFSQSEHAIVELRARTERGLWRGVHGLARPDVGRAFPDEPGAGRSGFEVRIPAPEDTSQPVTIEAVLANGLVRSFPLG